MGTLQYYLKERAEKTPDMMALISGETPRERIYRFPS